MAAPELFSPMPANADLSNAQDTKIDAIRAAPTTESLTVIKLDVSKLQSNKDVAINLLQPGSLQFAGQKAASGKPGQFAWSGKTKTMLPNPDALPQGLATFSVNGNTVSGSIRTETGVFQVQPLPGGLHALVKIREDALPAEHPPGGASNSQATVPALPEPKADLPELADVNEPVSVLVVYTAAAAAIREPITFAGLVVKETNQSFAGSQIANLQLKLAGTQVTDLVDTGSDEIDLANLVAGNGEAAQKVHALRDSLHADMVILIANNPAACGMAQAIAASPDTAYATVYHDCASTNLSFAHEIGHLMGACHDPAQGSECVPFSYGHGFQRPNVGMRTIMAYQCAGPKKCQRMPEWSRPPEWGNTEKSHDARVLAENAARIAAFRAGPKE